MKVIVAPEHFDRLPEITEDAITEDEEDMLDLAVDLDWEMRNTGEFPRSKGEYYGTPGWITRALLVSEVLPDRVWEPCAGDGKMVDVLRQHERQVVASDIEPRGEGIEQRDFLAAGLAPEGVAAIITNPPWDSGGRLSTTIVRHALQLMTPGRGLVAMLVPLAWDTAKSRRDLFMQPSYVAEVCLLDRMQVMEGTAVDKGLTSTIQATWHVWDLSRQRRSGIRKHFVTQSEANGEAGGLCEIWEADINGKPGNSRFGASAT